MCLKPNVPQTKAVYQAQTGEVLEPTIQAFLFKSTVMDPRFKGNLDDVTCWDQFREAVVAAATEPQAPEEWSEESDHTDEQ